MSLSKEDIKAVVAYRIDGISTKTALRVITMTSSILPKKTCYP